MQEAARWTRFAASTRTPWSSCLDISYSFFVLVEATSLVWRGLSKSRLGEAAWAAVCEGLRANPKAREPLEAPKDSPDYDKARVFAA